MEVKSDMGGGQTGCRTAAAELEEDDDVNDGLGGRVRYSHFHSFLGRQWWRRTGMSLWGCSRRD